MSTSSADFHTWDNPIQSMSRVNPIQMSGFLCGAAISKSIIKSLQLNLSIVTILWVVGRGRDHYRGLKKHTNFDSLSV